MTLFPSPALWGQKPLGRSAYTWWGLGLFFIKYNLDRLIARQLMDAAWYPWAYFAPVRNLQDAASGEQAQRFWIILLLVSLPFIAAGVMMTLRRLRDIHWPAWLVCLFFVPAINLVFFAFLCALPSHDPAWQEKPRGARWRRILTFRTNASSALAAVAGTALLAVPVVTFAVTVLRDYGWGLFVGIPFFIGVFSAVIDGVAGRRSWKRACGLALLSVGVAGVLCVLLAVEGVICVLMAAPLAAPLAILGALVGRAMQGDRGAGRENPGRLFAVSTVMLPLILAGEARQTGEPPLIAATTTIVVAAPPSVVWRHVVTFSELPPPREALFLAGIAYPVRATITGHGVGAVRKCEFSTGPFVEPITVWEENRRLAFDVLSQPHPMREWSPYARLNPAHLEGFFQSKRGQFLLTPLDGGRATRLEGTTWYQHAIWPSVYWQRWSDYLIHSIHHRVLDHIQTLSETEADLPPLS